MIGAADALDEAFDVLRRTDLDHKVHVAPVDAKIEGAGADDGPQGACGHRLFHPFALFAGEAAVVDADGEVLAILQPEVVEEKLGLGAGVVEDQGGLVAGHFVQDRGDGVAAAAAAPGRGVVGFQHRDVGVGAGVGFQDCGLGA